jgi:hypothetical protein
MPSLLAAELYFKAYIIKWWLGLLLKAHINALFQETTVYKN